MANKIDDSTLRNIVSLIIEEKHKEALESIERLIEENPENTDLWGKKGITLRKLGENRKAVEAYDKAIALNPENADAWFNRGVAFKSIAWTDKDPQGHQEAIKCYEQAVKYNAKHLSALVCLGNVHILQEKFQEGIDFYSQAVKHYPEEAEVWCNYGFGLCRSGDYQSALEASEKSLNLKPGLAQALLIKGACLKSMGKEDSARQFYNQAVTLDPELEKRAKFENLEKSIGPCQFDEIIKE